MSMKKYGNCFETSVINCPSPLVLGLSGFSSGNCAITPTNLKVSGIFKDPEFSRFLESEDKSD
jgi:hypothetical protein